MYCIYLDFNPILSLDLFICICDSNCSMCELFPVLSCVYILLLLLLKHLHFPRGINKGLSYLMQNILLSQGCPNFFHRGPHTERYLKGWATHYRFIASSSVISQQNPSNVGKWCLWVLAAHPLKQKPQIDYNKEK